jgi:probable rRNA maturation factor
MVSPAHSSTLQRPDGIRVSLANEQTAYPIDEGALIAAVEAILGDSPFTTASISVAIVDDSTIHELNRKYLKHDYPTDVLSFVLEEDETHLEGEVVASAETAAATAGDLGVSPDKELLLYVIHGTLHLVGFRDKTAEEIAAMRTAELKYLRRFGDAPMALYHNGANGRGESRQ